MNETRERVYYVYGLVRTERCIEGRSVGEHRSNGDRFLGGGFDEADFPRVWRGGHGISAIICTVDNEDFSDSGDDIRIGNLAWLAPHVVKHQSVLEKAMRFGPILPLRFGTLFESEERMDEFLNAHAATILDFLKRIEGKQEWAVQGYLDTRLCERLITARNGREKPSTVGLTPVAESLRAQLMRRDLKEAVDDWTSGKCAGFFESLMPLAANSSERRLLPRDGGADSCEMVANWAFLVERNGIDDFRALVERVSKEFSPSGLSFHLSGPWPPYSFCPALDEEPMNE